MAILTELACNLIQAKLRTLAPTYLQHAPDMEQYFVAVDDAICPYAFTIPTSGGSWWQKGGGYKICEQELTIFVYVESLAQKDFPIREVQGVRLRDQVCNLFITAENIPLATGDYQIYVASREDSTQVDSGLRGNLIATGKSWFGFTLPLKVRMQWSI